MTSGDAGLKLSPKALKLKKLAVFYRSQAVTHTQRMIRARGHGLKGMARAEEALASSTAHALSTEAKRQLVKVDEHSANVVDIIIGAGGVALQKQFAPDDKHPPRCEPPQQGPLRIRSLHAR